MPEKVDDCVQSILDDNPGMDESTAHAICNDMDNRGVLADWLEHESDSNTVALAQFRNPGEIRRVESGNTVTFKRVMLLSPGVWTDAGSEQTVDYSADGIRASAENFIDMDAVRESVPEWPQLSNEERAHRLRELGDDVLADEIPVNFLHGPSLYGAESLDEVGHVPRDSIIVDDDGQLYGDLELDGSTSQGETTIELMEEALEATQEPGAKSPPVGPSVEIPADEVSQDEPGVQALEEAWFSAVGVVFNPASRPVELGSQARQRQVALADGDASGSILLRTGGESNHTLKDRLRHRAHMSDGQSFDDLSDPELAKVLTTMQEDMTELKRTLQDDSEMATVFDLTEQYRQAGNDLQDTADDFRAWALENSDLDEDTLDDVLQAYLQAVEAEELAATPVEGLQDWLREMGAAGEEEPDDGEGDGEENGEEMSMEDLEEVKNVVGEVSQHLGDIKDMLTEADFVTEDDLGDLERRLEDIEDQPDPRSLVDSDETEFYSADGTEETTDGDHEEVFL